MRSFFDRLGIAIALQRYSADSLAKDCTIYADEFSQFGTNIITIQPGKSQTHGGNAASLAQSSRLP